MSVDILEPAARKTYTLTQSPREYERYRDVFLHGRASMAAISGERNLVVAYPGTPAARLTFDIQQGTVSLTPSPVALKPVKFMEGRSEFVWPFQLYSADKVSESRILDVVTGMEYSVPLAPNQHAYLRGDGKTLWIHDRRISTAWLFDIRSQARLSAVENASVGNWNSPASYTVPYLFTSPAGYGERDSVAEPGFRADLPIHIHESEQRVQVLSQSRLIFCGGLTSGKCRVVDLE